MRVAQGQAADLGDVHDLRRGEAVAARSCPRTAVLDGPQQVLIPFDLQLGVQAALHQNAGAAQIDGLLDLVEDHFLRMDVAFGVAHGPVEGAEAAIFGAEVGVVDVAVDDVADDAVRVQLAAHRVGGHADDRSGRCFKQFQSFPP